MNYSVAQTDCTGGCYNVQPHSDPAGAENAASKSRSADMRSDAPLNSSPGGVSQIQFE